MHWLVVKKEKRAKGKEEEEEEEKVVALLFPNLLHPRVWQVVVAVLLKI